MDVRICDVCRRDLRAPAQDGLGYAHRQITLNSAQPVVLHVCVDHDAVVMTFTPDGHVGLADAVDRL